MRNQMGVEKQYSMIERACTFALLREEPDELMKEEKLKCGPKGHVPFRPLPPTYSRYTSGNIRAARAVTHRLAFGSASWHAPIRPLPQGPDPPSVTSHGNMKTLLTLLFSTHSTPMMNHFIMMTVQVDMFRFGG